MVFGSGVYKIGVGEGFIHRVLIGRCLKPVGGSVSSKQGSETGVWGFQ